MPKRRGSVRLTLERVVRKEKQTSSEDHRRKLNVVIASYRGSDGYEYRKSFESYYEPEVPALGTHETLNKRRLQWKKNYVA